MATCCSLRLSSSCSLRTRSLSHLNNNSSSSSNSQVHSLEAFHLCSLLLGQMHRLSHRTLHFRVTCSFVLSFVLFLSYVSSIELSPATLTCSSAQVALTSQRFLLLGPSPFQVPSSPSVLRSLAVPLGYLRNPQLNQPLFGANNITGEELKNQDSSHDYNHIEF